MAHQHRHQHGIMSGWVIRPYDWFVGGVLMRGTYRRVADGLTTGIANGGRVLDIGTGPGRLVAEIARRRPDLDVVGVDPSTDMIRRARARTASLAGARVLLASAEDLPFHDAAVDAVVSTLSSHHWADPAAALAEAARVLRPGGRLWVIDLVSHLDENLSQLVESAGLRLSDDDAGLAGPPGHWLRLISARQPLAAA